MDFSVFRRARVLFVLLAEVIDVEFGGNANGAALAAGREDARISHIKTANKIKSTGQ